MPTPLSPLEIDVAKFEYMLDAAYYDPITNPDNTPDHALKILYFRYKPPVKVIVTLAGIGFTTPTHIAQLETTEEGFEKVLRETDEIKDLWGSNNLHSRLAIGNMKAVWIGCRDEAKTIRESVQKARTDPDQKPLAVPRHIKDQIITAFKESAAGQFFFLHAWRIPHDVIWHLAQ